MPPIPSPPRAAFLALALLLHPAAGQRSVDPGTEACPPVRPEGLAEETLRYSVYYQWGLVWMGAGTVDLALTREGHGPGTPWHATAIATSSRRIDRFFRVRDRYDTWLDPATLAPLRFERDVHEGPVAFRWSYRFDRDAGTVAWRHEGKRGTREGTLHEVPPCAGDLFSTLHLLRRVDWAAVADGTSVPINLVVDGKPQALSVRRAGRERIRVRDAIYDCLVLEPRLLVGDYFRDEDALRVWITADGRRLPVHAEAGILVGRLKADLIGS